MMILDDFSLAGKTVLVSGCNRGIGRAVAVALAEVGADIVGVSASIQPNGSEVENEILKFGRKASMYRCNFADRTELYSFIDRVKMEHGQIDILINNAGTIKRQVAAEHSDAYWDEVIAVNLDAQFIISREFGRLMVERGYGKIIFIASLLSFQGGITVPGYAASKGGIAQLTKALANEWAGHGVNVNAIAPGYIETDNTAALRANSERCSQILSRIPAGRWGKSEDLQGMAVFLASHASDYVSGTVLPVDGGWLGR